VSGNRTTRYEDEFQRLIALLREEGVSRYLEIGARDGNTFWKVMMALGDGAKGVAVDLPGGKWGWPESDLILNKTAERLRRRGKVAEVVLGDSASAAVREAVARHAPFDAVLIDGDHSYVGAMADWAAYAPMARIVAFHDIAPGPASAPGIEVQKVWTEITKDPSVERTEEIIGRTAGAGIGVVWRRSGGTAHEGKEELLRDGRVDLDEAGHRRKGATRGRKRKDHG